MQIHCLSGIKRTGNTVLAALLNQHPEIYASPLSPLVQMLASWDVDMQHHIYFVRSNQMLQRFDNIAGEIASLAYADVDKPLVLDREKDWGHPANLELAIRYVNPNPKIITTVRSIPDILASYVAVAGHQVMAKAIENIEFGAFHRDPVEAMCDHLMRPNGEIERTLFCIANSIKDPRCRVHLVEYDELLADGQKVMQGIYDFLEVEPHVNDFHNIEKLEIDDDAATGFPENLHVIRPQLSRSHVKAEEILPARVIRKYSGMEFWR